MKLNPSELVGMLLAVACGLGHSAEKTLQDCADCPVMVVLPAGKFLMGAEGDAATQPIHAVTMKYAFAMGKTEVTQAQFQFFLKRTGYSTDPAILSAVYAARKPVVNVDWYAASAYARWLSRHTGHRYRLPSEAEWEYAARGGKSTRYWWGELAFEACGKEHLNSTFFPFDQPCSTAHEADTVEVASALPNPWGLYDMLGNAGEWMLDCSSAGVTGYAKAPSDGSPMQDCGQYAVLHVVRGPSFLDVAAPRQTKDPVALSANIGFRLVRELP